jgi:hypothetical protein
VAAEKQELGDRPSGGLWAWALALAEARISQSVGDGGARTVGAIFTEWILRALEPPKRSTCKNNTNETIRALGLRLFEYLSGGRSDGTEW